MDLWIRNQDKTILKKVSCLSLSVFDGDVLVDDKHFGTYKTKKRALEVLNEIQRCLNGRTIISPRRIGDYERIKKEFFDGSFIITDGSVDVFPSDVIVYEMPKE